MKLEEAECITSSDVKSIFTFVPVDPAITIIKNKLEQEPEFHNQTSLSIQHITTLLEFCLKSTYFLFQGTNYEQLHEQPWGHISIQ